MHPTTASVFYQVQSLQNSIFIIQVKDSKIKKKGTLPDIEYDNFCSMENYRTQL